MKNKLFAFLSASFLLIFTFSAFSASSDDLLSPDLAFKASLSQSSPDSIQATWDIADGYYMYRKRFSFESDTAGITLGAPVFPKGKMKDDPGFGTVETSENNILPADKMFETNNIEMIVDEAISIDVKGKRVNYLLIFCFLVCFLSYHRSDRRR